MQAEDLVRLKKQLLDILPEEGMGTVIKALKGHFPPDVPKFTALIQLEARLNDANLKRIKGILSEEQLLVQYNQLREDLVQFIDQLRPEDFTKESAKKAKTGSVLYQLPHRMELQKRTKCIVRLAYEESVVIQNIELTADTSLKSIRISETMEVSLLDPSGDKNFDIKSISSPEQFLEDDDYSEWVFYVTPLKAGEHPLVLKVSVIELIAGKDRKKEIVLEEFITIVSQPVEEEEMARPFQNAGYSFAFGATAVLDAPEASPRPAAVPGTVSAAAKKYGMVLGAFAMLLVVSWALGLFEFVAWQEVLWSDNVEKYESFIERYPDGRFASAARERRDFKTAEVKRSDSLLVEFLVDYPDSELRDRARSLFHLVSDEDLNERLHKRKTQKEKEGIDKRSGSPKTSDKGTPEKQPKPDSTPDEGQTGGSQTVSNNANPADQPTNGTTDTHHGTPNRESQTNDGPLPPSERGRAEAPPSLDMTGLNFPSEEKILGALKWLESNMVTIEGGKFMMGCDPKTSDDCSDFNMPVREVKVGTFQLCRYEVTQLLWLSIMGYNPSYVEVKNCALCPVEGVSFREVQEFIGRLNKRTGKKFRLPSEAEWEYAARGGKDGPNTIYAGSNNHDEVAWYHKNSKRRPQPVGKKKPNSLGLYDMSGNVFEWCEDVWHTSYKGAPSKGDPRTKGGMQNNRVIRGGSWLDDDPEYLRIDFRDMDVDSLKNHITGFRLAL